MRNMNRFTMNGSVYPPFKTLSVCSTVAVTEPTKNKKNSCFWLLKRCGSFKLMGISGRNVQTVQDQSTYWLSKGIVPQDSCCGVVVLTAMDDHNYRQGQGLQVQRDEEDAYNHSEWSVINQMFILIHKPPVEVYPQTYLTSQSQARKQQLFICYSQVKTLKSVVFTLTWKTSSLPPTVNCDSNSIVNFSSVTDSAPRRSERLIRFRDWGVQNDASEKH